MAQEAGHWAPVNERVAVGGQETTGTRQVMKWFADPVKKAAAAATPDNPATAPMGKVVSSTQDSGGQLAPTGGMAASRENMGRFGDDEPSPLMGLTAANPARRRFASRQLMG